MVELKPQVWAALLQAGGATGSSSFNTMEPRDRHRSTALGTPGHFAKPDYFHSC
jgi:hypothetical protein